MCARNRRGYKYKKILSYECRGIDLERGAAIFMKEGLPGGFCVEVRQKAHRMAFEQEGAFFAFQIRGLSDGPYFNI